jgi:SnoaL-like domain
MDGARLSAAGRVEILDLYGRCGLAIDAGDGSGWAVCFTEDGTFTAYRGEGTEPRHVGGREELDRFARAHRSGPHAGTRHHFTNIVTGPAPGGPFGRAEILSVEGRAVLGSGLYEDELTQVEGAWRLNRRVVTHERLRA